MTRTWFTVTAVVLFALLMITAFRFELVMESVLSLVSYIVLSLSGGLKDSYLSAGLFEYWLAALVWCSSIGYAIFRLIRFRNVSGTRRAGSINKTGMMLLVGMAFVATVTPFLVAQKPDLQGNLMTTRLLPPLSKGVMVEAIKPDPDIPLEEALIERMYRQSRQFLLERRIDVTAGPDVVQKAGASPTLFVLGTDDIGRDVFSRIVAGTRVSFLLGIAAALGAVFIGGVLGFVAGFSNRFLDRVIMGITDLFLSIPAVFLIVGCVAFLGQSLVMLFVVLVFTGWMNTARVIRGEVLALREREFILAARMLRLSTARIILRHIVPNVRPVLITASVLQFANAVMAEATLSFLGLGVQPPTATWGNMMGEGMGYLASAWWIGVFPGAVLTSVVVAAHSIVDETKLHD